MMERQKSTAVDMTSGPIAKQLILFAVPLLLGNLFQLLYNTVDVLVVGNFVGKEALAAVGSTTPIINIVVLFFNGISVGGGVVIGQYYGARDMDKLHRAVETTMAVTFLCSVIFAAGAVLAVPAMLKFMSTPDDVMNAAGIYLRIYFGGLPGLLIYNMGSGILRAVGDTVRPLMFLVLTSVVNIILDLLFVIGFHTGIAGVAWATIIAQFISAVFVLVLLSRTKDIYRMTWNDLAIDRRILARILSVGLPAGIQSMVTAFSNVFVQSYINSFGSDCMAGWSCYNKLDQFVFLPIQSMANSATTFVSQNVGAGEADRARRGTRQSVMISLSITFVTSLILFVFSHFAVGMFTGETEVIRYGVLFIRLNVFFLLANTVNHVLAGAIRGHQDAKGPMAIMLFSFVLVRQIYLFVVNRFARSEAAIGFGYPVGWMVCCMLELAYYFVRKNRGFYEMAEMEKPACK